MNNAGVLNNGSTYENAKLVMETNYHGVKRVTKALLPYMRASSMGSRIINVSSELGQLQVNLLLRLQVYHQSYFILMIYRFHFEVNGRPFILLIE